MRVIKVSLIFGKHKMTRGLELSIPPSQLTSQGRREGLDVESIPNGHDLIYHICVMRPHKNPKDRVLRASGLVNTWR